MKKKPTIEDWLTTLRVALAKAITKQALCGLVLNMGLENPSSEKHVVRRLIEGGDRHVADDYNRAVLAILGNHRRDLELRATARLNDPTRSDDHEACKALLWCLNHYR